MPDEHVEPLEALYLAICEFQLQILGAHRDSDPFMTARPFRHLMARMILAKDAGIGLEGLYTFVAEVLQAEPLPDLPHFDRPIFWGNGQGSVQESKKALAMLHECWVISSGMQQGGEESGEKARQRELLREIVRSVIGEEIDFRSPVETCDLCREPREPREPLVAVEAPKQTPDGRWFQQYGMYLPSARKACEECAARLQAHYEECAAYLDIEDAMKERVRVMEQAFLPTHRAHIHRVDAFKQETRAKRPSFHQDKSHRYNIVNDTR